MAVSVRYLSGKKGSNPGGKVRISSGSLRSEGGGFDAYLKFCLTPSNVKGTSFGAVNQPVYEAATFELAKRFGLHVPDFYVLLNTKQDVSFENWKENGENNPHGRKFYFVSKWLTCPLDDRDKKDNLGKASEIVREEMPYLDFLHVSDITGKRQNLLLCEDPNNNPAVFYIDLGCSFVRAIDGKLVSPMKSGRMGNGHNLKIAEKHLSRYVLIAPDNESGIPLESLPFMIRNMTLPTLNPRGRVDLADLVSEDEVQEMERDIVHNAFKNLHKLEDRGYLIKLS